MLLLLLLLVSVSKNCTLDVSARDIQHIESSQTEEKGINMMKTLHFDRKTASY